MDANKISMIYDFLCLTPLGSQSLFLGGILRLMATRKLTNDKSDLKYELVDTSQYCHLDFKKDMNF